MTEYALTFSVRRLASLLNESGLVDARPLATGFVQIVGDGREAWLEHAPSLGEPWTRVTGTERKVEEKRMGQYL